MSHISCFTFILSKFSLVCLKFIEYLDHPWEKPFDYGDAIQMYNDDGRFGGFFEIECHGPAKILEPNEKLGHTVKLFVIIGNLELLKEITGEKLEVDMGRVKLY